MGTLLDFALSGSGSMKPGMGQSIMFLSKTFYFHTGLEITAGQRTMSKLI